MIERDMEEKWQEIDNKMSRIFGSHYMSIFNPEQVIGKKYIDEILKGEQGVIISGGVGVGKTMALIYIYRELVKKIIDEKVQHGDIFYLSDLLRISVYFAPQMFNDFHSGEDYAPTRYVLIDDLGREYVEPFSLSRFEIFIEGFYRDTRKRIFITTNLTREQFIQRQGWARINDRLLERCRWMDVSGSSRRPK